MYMVLNKESDLMVKYSGISTVPDIEKWSSLKIGKEETVYLTKDESELANKVQNDKSYFEKLCLVPGFARLEFEIYNLKPVNL